MKKEQIYIGDIKRCTIHDPFYEIHTTGIFAYAETGVKYEGDIIKKNAILVKDDNDMFIDIEMLNSVLNYVKLYKDKWLMSTDLYTTGIYTKLSVLLMRTIPSSVDGLFVDKKTLKPYFYNFEKEEKISARQLRKNYLCNKNSNRNV